MQDKSLFVEIITPQSVLFTGNALAVSVPGTQSPFQVLHNHAAIVSSLDPGIVIIKDEDSVNKYFATDSGLVEVRENVVSILVQDAVAPDLINLEKENNNKNETSALLVGEKNEQEKEKLSNKLKYIENKIKSVNYIS
jgi:F-type H+-transporting ATPase subunit epsilon